METLTNKKKKTYNGEDTKINGNPNEHKTKQATYNGPEQNSDSGKSKKNQYHER